MNLPVPGEHNLPDRARMALQPYEAASDRAALMPQPWAADDGSDAGAAVSTVLAALRRGWMYCLPLGLICGTAAAAVLWYLFVPQYEAVAEVRVLSKAPYIVFPQETQSHTNPLMQTQIELIRSPVVLERAVERDDVKQLPAIRSKTNPEDWLALKLGVQPVAQSEFILISFTCSDPHEAMTICNGVLDSFLQVQTDFADAQTRRIIELLKGMGGQRESELESLRDRVRELAKKAGGDVSLSGGVTSARTSKPAVAELQRRLTDAEFEQEVLKARLAALRESNAANTDFTPAAIDTALQQNGQYKALETLIITKRSQLLEVEGISTQGARDPMVGQLNREIERHEAKLATLREQLRPQIVATLQAQQVEITKKKEDELKSQLDAFTALQTSLRAQLETQKEEQGATGDEPVELEFAKLDLQRAEEVYQRISGRTEALSAELKAPASVSEFYRAKLPRKPLEEVPMLKMTAVGIAGFLFPFGLLFGWERLVRRVALSRQLSQDTRLPILGEVAVLPERPFAAQQPRSRTHDRQITRFQESIEYLRINLAVQKGFDGLQSLLIASAVSREGKTRLACNLAICLARSYREKTLLIDADLRSPDIHRLFEVQCEPGLAEVLDSRVSWRDAVVTTWGQHLHFIPAGRLSQSPHLLLSGGRLEALIEELKGEYRFIVIDGPPVLPVGDTLLLARAVDGVILSAMHNVSREPEVRSTVDRLRSAGANILGAVLCAVPHPGYGYGYRDYVYGQREL